MNFQIYGFNFLNLGYIKIDFYVSLYEQIRTKQTAKLHQIIHTFDTFFPILFEKQACINLFTFLIFYFTSSRSKIK